jgi:hypothetical protein
MNREERRKQMKVVGKKNLENPDRFVTQAEMVDSINQVGENVGRVQEGLVESVNTMYGYHLFPLQMEEAALVKLLIDKGVITQEELDEKVKEHKQSILDKAQQIKENDEGKLEKVSEEEAKETENKAVLKASTSNREEK